MGIANPEKLTIKKILVPVMAIGSKDSKSLLKSLRENYPRAKITVLVNEDRAGAYENFRTYRLKQKKLKSLVYLAHTFIRLRRKKYDCVAAITPSPFIYVAKRTLFFNQDDQTIAFHQTGLLRFLKLCLMLCWGEILSLLLLPILMLKSMQYKKESQFKLPDSSD